MRKPDTNSTNLIYKGEVDLSININGKLYSVTTYNEGTTYLKYIFVKMLSGDFNKDDIPGYMSIYRLDKGNLLTLFTKKKAVIDAVQLINESAEEEEGLPTAIKFTSYIAFDDLVSEVSSTDSDNHYYFYLWPAKGNNHLALIDVSAKTLSYITPGTTATATWTMRLLNYNEY